MQWGRQSQLWDCLYSDMKMMLWHFVEGIRRFEPVALSLKKRRCKPMGCVSPPPNHRACTNLYTKWFWWSAALFWGKMTPCSTCYLHLQSWNTAYLSLIVVWGDIEWTTTNLRYVKNMYITFGQHRLHLWEGWPPLSTLPLHFWIK